MGKQHFDLFTFVARAHIRRYRCDSPSHITRGFMDAANDLAKRSVRAALGLFQQNRPEPVNRFPSQPLAILCITSLYSVALAVGDIINIRFPAQGGADDHRLELTNGIARRNTGFCHSARLIADSKTHLINVVH